MQARRAAVPDLSVQTPQPTGYGRRLGCCPPLGIEVFHTLWNTDRALFGERLDRPLDAASRSTIASFLAMLSVTESVQFWEYPSSDGLGVIERITQGG
jgi:hypothetical protein